MKRKRHSFPPFSLSKFPGKTWQLLRVKRETRKGREGTLQPLGSLFRNPEIKW